MVTKKYICVEHSLHKDVPFIIAEYNPQEAFQAELKFIKKFKGFHNFQSLSICQYRTLIFYLKKYKNLCKILYFQTNVI